jgi:hypothetical protein
MVGRAMKNWTRHNFAIEPLGRRPGWFTSRQYRYYCIRCHWMFQVEGFKVCALDESSEPLPEPENGQRVSSFALGPCVAMLPECSWSTSEITRNEANRRAVMGPSLAGRLGQSRPFKSVALLKPTVVHLTSRIQPSTKKLA